MNKKEFSSLKVGDKVVVVEFGGQFTRRHKIKEIRKKGRGIEIKLDYSGCPFMGSTWCYSIFKDDEKIDSEFVEKTKSELKKVLCSAINELVDNGYFCGSEKDKAILAKYFHQELNSRDVKFEVGFEVTESQSKFSMNVGGCDNDSDKLIEEVKRSMSSK